MDALRHAEGIAARCAEATEGTDAVFVFEGARKAISNFSHKDSAMVALASAAVRERLP